MFARFIEFLKFHPTRYWFYLFFFLNIAFGMSGASNAGIRFSTLCAMVEDQSFKVDNYYFLSVDWSRTPDGHYYSSKAPGPILLAYPIFWTLDKISTLGIESREQRDQARFKARGVTMPIVCLLLLAFPFALLAAFWIQRLEQSGVSYQAQQLTAVAFLFGNTTAFFANNFFAHTLVATLLLATFTLILNRRPAWAGLAFGWAVLSDYSIALLIPFLVPVFYRQFRFQVRPLLRFIAGGLPALVLLMAYHTLCFGGPFDLPYKHVNPEFKESVDPNHSLWGVMAFVPNPVVFWEFLFGPARGFLFTLPWMLVLLAGLVWLAKQNRFSQPRVRDFLWMFPGSLFVLMWLFASYGKWWHGGDSPGPRFICAVFPGFAVLLGLTYDAYPKALQKLAQLGVFFSVLFFITVFSVLLFPDDAGPIWHWYYRKMFVNFRGVYWGRLAILVPAFLWTWHLSRRATAPIDRLA